ncbi:MAG: DEAD/DEAH box helicase [Leptotrichiaceae bacterium]|nr:DEAD/DEAH box helicase [Leptotrichiaceae bacterium]
MILSSEQINQIQIMNKDNNNSLLVLKGIKVEDIIPINIDLKALVSNKFKYFSDIMINNRNVVSIEEYILLSEFFNSQFQKINFLEYNLYFNYYPLNLNLNTSEIENLLNFYDDESKEEKEEFESIRFMTEIYGNIEKIDEKLYCVYSDIEANEKFTFQKLFPENENFAISSVKKVNPLSRTYQIFDEYSYIEFLENWLENKGETFFLDPKVNLKENIAFLNKISLLIKNSINDNSVFINEDINTQNINRKFPEIYEILREYWNYDSFRSIKLYNQEKLDEKIKETYEISQEDVINTILLETEKALAQQPFKDVFVTAPTGAGKSVMFQIPGIYLGKRDFITIVISPLIGLMEDQVKNLEMKNYSGARTINSDISPLKREEIQQDIFEGKCNILYISPETLLSKSDIQQLIGNRKIGLFVIDEAHIVTTWGKQFRPDYWYLGDRLTKIKKEHHEKYGHYFVTATFTATSIYGGLENMFKETKQSLNMIAPHVFLGYLKRNDLTINVKQVEKKTGRTEYQTDKFDSLIDKINLALFKKKKILIYFPTVALINGFFDYCKNHNLENFVTKYNGQMSKFDKKESYEDFLSSRKLVMLATKAFGMGIDINDIEIITHFAPTGNVCDYVQEIGRAARRYDLSGEAQYDFMSNDFKFINRFHGMSTIKPYQLISVMKKIIDIYNNKSNDAQTFTKKKNALLIDAENFSHIFDNPFIDESDAINKVKTALLIIQKDYELKFGYSPFNVKPIPLFAVGYFVINKLNQNYIKNKYGDYVREVNEEKSICSVNLERIWDKHYNNYSFPKFKYLLYSKDEELTSDLKDMLTPVISIDITFKDNFDLFSSNLFSIIESIFYGFAKSGKFYKSEEIENDLLKHLNEKQYKIQAFVEILLSSMQIYQRDFSTRLSGKVIKNRSLNNGNSNFSFESAVEEYFMWLKSIIKNTRSNMNDNTYYLINDMSNNKTKELFHVLGVYEILELISFKALGGSNSQIYIYINQLKPIQNAVRKPYSYNNRLLSLVDIRHKLSVEMLNHMFTSNFTSKEIWNILEDYFLGIIPENIREKFKDVL